MGRYAVHKLKNDIENALLGLNHPEGTLRPEDFVIIKANWENKDKIYPKLLPS